MQSGNSDRNVPFGPAATPKTLSVPEAGRIYFELGRNASYAAAARGEIPTLRVGSRLRVPVLALERMLETAGSRDYEASLAAAPKITATIARDATPQRLGGPMARPGATLPPIASPRPVIGPDDRTEGTGAVGDGRAALPMTGPGVRRGAP